MSKLEEQLEILNNLPHGYNLGKTFFKDSAKKYFVFTFDTAIKDFEDDFNRNMPDSSVEEILGEDGAAIMNAPTFYGATPEEAVQKAVKHYG